MKGYPNHFLKLQLPISLYLTKPYYFLNYFSPSSKSGTTIVEPFLLWDTPPKTYYLAKFLCKYYVVVVMVLLINILNAWQSTQAESKLHGPAIEYVHFTHFIFSTMRYGSQCKYLLQIFFTLLFSAISTHCNLFTKIHVCYHSHYTT